MCIAYSCVYSVLHCMVENGVLVTYIEVKWINNFCFHAVTRVADAQCRVSKQIMIHQLPPVLILHLKRFEISYDGVIKDNRHISFPEILDMAPYCTTKCIEVRGNVYIRATIWLY